MELKQRTEGTTTVYWAELEDGDLPRVASVDTTAYQTYAAKDDPRLRCDECAACLVWECGGITARHHFIHLDEFDYFTKPDHEWEGGVLPGSYYSEHSDRDSGV